MGKPFRFNSSPQRSTAGKSSRNPDAASIRCRTYDFLMLSLGHLDKLIAILFDMHLFILWSMRLITTLFFLGMAGSVIVIVISFVEDFRELFSSDEPHLESPKGANSAPPAA